ncbi:hypothetical protein D3877_08300 [Azospirillum cavernae]|uniref:Uncharacterized protein n=1 Tax=Azospirillum cavernae TaxID=2320860 RepID=A0A418W3D6_9PROT|nr:hypothetical protein D3877_08300 [Azospirillum cavernae]
MAALVTRYDRCLNDGDAFADSDPVAAVESCRRALNLKEQIYEVAAYLSIPLPYTGRLQDDMQTVRAFIAGGGWH